MYNTHKKRMKLVYNLKLVLLLLFFSSPAYSSELPIGTSFIALKNNAWHGYYVNKHGLNKFSKEENMQEITYLHEAKIIAYIDSESRLKLFSLDKNYFIAVNPSKDVSRFSQIKGYKNTQGDYEIIGVSLKNGKSRSTEIVSYNLKKGAYEIAFSPRLTVFEPIIFGNKISYLGLNCVEMCKLPTQEIWTGSLKISDHSQRTNMGLFLKNVSWSKDGSSIYFAAANGYGSSIWELNDKNELTRHTNGHIDTYPFELSSNSIIFLRKANSKVSIFIKSKGTTTSYKSNSFDSIRDLEIGREI